MWTGAGGVSLIFALVRLQRFSGFLAPRDIQRHAASGCRCMTPPPLAALTSLGHAGFFYTCDMMFNFHVGFIGKYNTQKTLVMDGRAIARYYVTKGTFAVDFITACCWMAQVTGTLSTSPCSRLP